MRKYKMASLLALERGGTNVLLDCIKITDPVKIKLSEVLGLQRRRCFRNFKQYAQIQHWKFFSHQVVNFTENGDGLSTISIMTLPFSANQPTIISPFYKFKNFNILF